MPKRGETLRKPSTRAPLATRQARLLHAALTIAGHTVARLAQMCSVHHTTAGRWLYGVRPDRDSAKLIVKEYEQHGITLDVLGYGDDR